MELMSIRAYAKHAGVTHPAILKAVRRGQIPLVDGMVDPVVADRARARNVRPRAAGADGWPPQSLVAAQARLAAAKAERAELELAVRRGELERRDVIENTLHEQGTRMRVAVQVALDAVALSLVGQNDLQTIRGLLRKAYASAVASLPPLALGADEAGAA